MPAQRLMWMAWPAFLSACMLEMTVFALVDPADLHWLGHSLPLSPMAVYTLAFFVFWLIALVSSALALLLSMPPTEVNHRTGGDPPGTRKAAVNGRAGTGRSR